MKCPECGCNDCSVVDKGMRWGTAWRKVRCRHCGFLRRESVKKEEESMAPPNGTAVDYHVVRCPECNSRHTQVYSTNVPMRYHKCLDCEHRFKSVERA